MEIRNDALEIKRAWAAYCNKKLKNIFNLPKGTQLWYLCGAEDL